MWEIPSHGTAEDDSLSSGIFEDERLAGRGEHMGERNIAAASLHDAKHANSEHNRASHKYSNQTIGLQRRLISHERKCELTSKNLQLCVAEGLRSICNCCTVRMQGGLPLRKLVKANGIVERKGMEARRVHHLRCIEWRPSAAELRKRSAANHCVRGVRVCVSAQSSRVVLYCMRQATTAILQQKPYLY